MHLWCFHDENMHQLQLQSVGTERIVLVQDNPKRQYNQRCRNTGNNEKKNQVIIKSCINRINFGLFSLRKHFHNNMMMPSFFSKFNIKKVTQCPRFSLLKLLWLLIGIICARIVGSQLIIFLLRRSVVYGTYGRLWLP